MIQEPPATAVPSNAAGATLGAASTVEADGAHRHGAVTRVLYPAVFLIVVLGLWQLVVTAFNVPSYVMPSPSLIGQKFVDTRGLLWSNFSITVVESLSGFGLAVVFGILLAVLITRYRLVELTVFPYLVALHTVPIIALGPLLILWFGFGLVPKIVVAGLISFLPIVINTVRGLRSVDYRVLELMGSLSASEWQVFQKIRFWTALPYVFSAFKVSVASCVVGAVVGEFLGSDTGLGSMIIQASTRLDTPLLFVAIVLLALLGVSLFLLTSLLERRALRWYTGSTIL